MENRYVDLEFPPDNSSIFGTNVVDGPPSINNLDISTAATRNLTSGKSDSAPDMTVRKDGRKVFSFKGQIIKWKRLQDLLPNLCSIKCNGIGFPESTVKQGLLGDCWLVSAMNALPSSMIRLMFPGKPGATLEYPTNNLFKIELWVDGRPVQVTIDDHLPVNEQNEIIFATTTSRALTANPSWTVLWGALVEKAVAKVFGSYQAMENGHAAEGLALLSHGYLVEDMSISGFKGCFRDQSVSLATANKIRFYDSALFHYFNSSKSNSTTLYQSFNTNAFPKFSKDPETLLAHFMMENLSHGNLLLSSVTDESASSVGLPVGHTFTVSQVVRISETNDMGNDVTNHSYWIKLLNPWGRTVFTSKYDRMKRLELQKTCLFDVNCDPVNRGHDNNYVWITAESFCRYFSTLVIGHRTHSKHVRDYDDDGKMFLVPYITQAPVRLLESLVKRISRIGGARYPVVTRAIHHSKDGSIVAIRKPFENRIFDLSRSHQIFQISNDAWTSGTAGGCINYPSSFFQNPNYRLILREEAIVTISLGQSVFQSVKEYVEAGKIQEIVSGANTLRSIGFTILRVEDNRAWALHDRLDSKFWGAMSEGGRNGDLGGSGLGVRLAGMVTFLNASNVIGRYRLNPGTYVMIPCTFTPNLCQQYNLTVHVNYIRSEGKGLTARIDRLPRLEASLKQSYVRIAVDQIKIPDIKTGYSVSIHREGDQPFVINVKEEFRRNGSFYGFFVGSRHTESVLVKLQGLHNVVGTGTLIIPTYSKSSSSSSSSCVEVNILADRQVIGKVVFLVETVSHPNEADNRALLKEL